MHTATLLLELGGVILGLGILGRLASRLGLSPIPLYLLAGLAFGQGGLLPLVTAKGFIAAGAEVGVILLLLLLGLEYSAGELLATLRAATPAGLLDLLLNSTPGVAAGLLLGWGWPAAMVLGDLGRLGNRETPVVLSILVLEDLAMAAYLPIVTGLLAGGGLLAGTIHVAVGVAAVGVMLLVALRHGAALSRLVFSPNDEVLLLLVLGLALVVAGLAQRLQVSAAVGAFLVGIALSGPAADGARALLTPLRDLFAAVFFVFFGLQTAPASIPPVALTALALAVVTAATKVMTGWWAARRAGIGTRGRVRAGTALVARGEFSIVIAGLAATTGVEGRLGPLAATYVLLLAGLGPLLARVADPLAAAWLRWGGGRAGRAAAAGRGGQAGRAAAAGRGGRWRLLARLLLALAIVGAIYLVILHQVADVSSVWATIASLRGPAVAILLAGAVWNLVSYLFPQVVALPGLKLRQAAVESHASTAVGNLLPAGAAIGPAVTFQLYTSWGFTRAETTRSLLVQGVWNNFTKLGMPVVALALLAVGGDANPGLATAAVIGLVLLAAALLVFVLMLRSDQLAFKVGTRLGVAASWFRRLLRRPPVTTWGAGAVRFRTTTIGLLRRRWFPLTAATLVSHLSLYLLLLLTLRTLGVPQAAVGWTAVLGAFSLVRLASALPITPGGLGFVELGLTGALIAAGGDRSRVVAAVLVFRVLTWLLPIPIGAATYAGWRLRRWARGRRPAAY